jgi:hypothetical protein
MGSSPYFSAMKPSSAFQFGKLPKIGSTSDPYMLQTEVIKVQMGTHRTSLPSIEGARHSSVNEALKLTTYQSFPINSPQSLEHTPSKQSLHKAKVLYSTASMKELRNTKQRSTVSTFRDINLNLFSLEKKPIDVKQHAFF